MPRSVFVPIAALALAGAMPGARADTSVPPARKDKPAPLAPDEVIFTYQGGFPLLHDKDVDPRWGTGPFRVESVSTMNPITESADDHVEVRQGVDDRRLPPPLRHWRGRALYRIRDDGTFCTDRVADLRLVADAWPDIDGEDRRWLEAVPRAGRAASAAFAKGWRERIWLYASTTKECEGGFWARSALLPKPPVAVPRCLDEEPEAALARAGFEALPEYARLQRRHENLPAGYARSAGRRWDERGGQTGCIRSFTLPDTVLLVHSAYSFALDEGLLAVWELVRTPHGAAERWWPRQRHVLPIHKHIDVRSIADLRGDGRLTYVYTANTRKLYGARGVLREVDGRLVDEPAP